MAGFISALSAACGHGLAPSHARQLRSPFTGEPAPALNRVLAVKIDIVSARAPRPPLDPPCSHATLNATATACVFKFCGEEPEGHHAVPCHVKIDDPPRLTAS